MDGETFDLACGPCAAPAPPACGWCLYAPARRGLGPVPGSLCAAPARARRHVRAHPLAGPTRTRTAQSTSRAEPKAPWPMAATRRATLPKPGSHACRRTRARARARVPGPPSAPNRLSIAHCICLCLHWRADVQSLHHPRGVTSSDAAAQRRRLPELDGAAAGSTSCTLRQHPKAGQSPLMLVLEPFALLAHRLHATHTH